MNRQARRKAASISRVQQKARKKMKRTIANTLAAGSVGVAGLGAGHGFAQDASGTMCTVSGNVVTCTGDQSDGIRSGVDFSTDGVDTLVVKDLTAAIAPLRNMPMAHPYIYYPSLNGSNGIDFIADDGDVTIDSNTGDFGIDSPRRGINGITRGDGNVTITSAGDIESDGQAIYAGVNGAGDVTITNSGELESDDSSGITAYNYDGTITITNTGDIFADDAGIEAYSYAAPIKKIIMGDASPQEIQNNIVIDNDGNIASGRSAVNARSSTTSGSIEITNTGAALSRSSALNARTYGGGDIIITNSGLAGSFYGGGIYAYSEGAGDVTINNSGEDVPADFANYANAYDASTVSFNGAAISVRSIQRNEGAKEYSLSEAQNMSAMEMDVEAGDVEINNSAILLAGRSGIDSYSRYGNTTIENTGDINIISNLNYLYQTLGGVDIDGPGIVAFNKGPGSIGGGFFGINARTDEGDLAIKNTGDLVFGQFNVPRLFDDKDEGFLLDAGTAAFANEGGGLSFSNLGPPKNNGNLSIGINAQNYFGEIMITNSGDITFGEEFDLYGLLNEAYADIGGEQAEITIANMGPPPLFQPLFSGTSIGINAQSDSRKFDGPITIDNSGDIEISQILNNGFNPPPFNIGLNQAATLSVANFGPPQFGFSANVGISARNGNGTIDIDNSGDITINETTLIRPILDGWPIAIALPSKEFAFANDGPGIPFFPGNFATTGISASSRSGDVEIENSGQIELHRITEFTPFLIESARPPRGMQLVAENGIDAPPIFGGQPYAGPRFGINAYSENGKVTVVNTGDITLLDTVDDFLPFRGGTLGGIFEPNELSGGAGIYAGSYYGDVSIANEGKISSQSILNFSSGPSASGAVGTDIIVEGPMISSGGLSVGIDAYSGHGNVTVANTGDIEARVAGINTRSYDGDITVANSGKIIATGFDIYEGPPKGLLGNEAEAFGSMQTFEQVVLTPVQLSPDLGAGINVRSSSGTVDVVNSGTIEGTTGVNIGRRFGNQSQATVTNSGMIKGTNGFSVNFQGEANDTLNVQSGAVFDGAIDFGNNSPDDVDVLNIASGASVELEFRDSSGNDSDAASAPETINAPGGVVVQTSDDGTSAVVIDNTGPATLATTTPDITDAIFRSISNSIDAGGAGGQVTRLSFFPQDDPKAVSQEKNVWASFFGGHSEFDGDSSTLGFRNSYGGLIAGVEYGNVNAGGAYGFFGGYAESGTRVSGGSNETDVDSFFGGVYYKDVFGPVKLNASLTLGVSDHTNERVVGAATAIGEFDGYFVSPTLSLATDLPGNLPLEASVRFNYTGVFLDGYTETGVGAPLTVNSTDLHFLGTRAQLKAPRTFIDDDGSETSFDIRAGVDAEYSLGSGNVSGTVANTPFTVSSNADDNISGFLGFDLSRKSADGFSTVRISAETQSNFSDSFEVQGEIRLIFEF